MIKHNLNEFAVRMSETELAWSERFANRVSASAIDALGYLQTISPVDTGTYRGSHALTINKPSSFVLPPLAKGEPKGREAEAEKRMEEADFRLKRAKAKLQHLTVSIFITNNLVYAPILETRSQSPKAFFSRAEQKWQNSLGKITADMAAWTVTP